MALGNLNIPQGSGSSSAAAVSAWAPSTAYTSGQLVRYSGRLWRSLTGFTSSSTFNEANWAPIGHNGLDGSNFTSGTTRLLRKQAAKVAAATGACKMLCIGDSTMWGQLATNMVTDAAPAILLAQLQAAGVNAAQGLIGAGSSSQVGTDSRWTPGASWAHATSQGLGNTGAWQALGAGPSDALRFTPGILCDRMDVYYLINTGIGSFTHAENGGAASASVPCAGTAAVGKLTITVPLASNNYVEFIQSTNTVMIFAIEAYQNSTPQFRVGNAGASSSATSGWITATSAFSSLNILKAYAPDLTLIMLGINDKNASVTAATFNTNMQTLITAAQVSGDVILVTPVPQSSDASSLIAAYAGQMASLAVTNRCGLIDINGRFIDYTTANAASLMGDTTHPNSAGYLSLGTSLATALKPVLL